MHMDAQKIWPNFKLNLQMQTYVRRPSQEVFKQMPVFALDVYIDLSAFKKLQSNEKIAKREQRHNICFARERLALVWRCL